MIEMLKRHEVQVLRRAGHTWKQIAALSGVSVRTVRRIAAESAITTIDNTAERARRGVGRPSRAEAYRAVLVQALTEEPTVRTVELLHRARQAGYTGGKSAVYALAQTLRTRVVTPLVRFEGLPGEFSQHDFGEVRVRYQNETEEIVHFFASRLKYSRWAEVTVVPDQQVEALVRALVDHIAAFGGIPLVAVFDRPKTVALKWGRDGVVTEWNATFAGVALDLGLGVEVCWPYRPQEKGSVENLVGWVKGSFFKQRRFLDRADLEHLAHRSEYRPAVTRHGRAARGADRGGAGAVAAVTDRPGGPRAADSDRRQSDGRGHPRWASVLDAARGHRSAGDVVPLSRTRPNCRRSLQCRPCAAIRGRRRLDLARASRPAGRRGLRQAGAAIPPAAAFAQSRSRRPGLPHRAHSSAPPDLDW